MLDKKIIDLYSAIHSPITYTNGPEVSFEGSQKQVEFFSAWNHITEFYKDKELTNISFLEIGAWKGLWGLAFYEFCKMKNIKGSYTTVTMIDHDPNNRPLYKTIEFLTQNNFESNLINMNTFDDRVVEEVYRCSNEFNIVFIDAGHKYEEVMNDIKKFSGFSKDLLMFHDIGPREVHPNFGVYQAIKDSNIELHWEIADNIDHMGIGIHYVNGNK
jgi:hypothetical protein